LISKPNVIPPAVEPRRGIMKIVDTGSMAKPHEPSPFSSPSQRELEHTRETV
jgi:hypothetical protein